MLANVRPGVLTTHAHTQAAPAARMCSAVDLLTMTSTTGTAGELSQAIVRRSVCGRCMFRTASAGLRYVRILRESLWLVYGGEQGLRYWHRNYSHTEWLHSEETLQSQVMP